MTKLIAPPKVDLKFAERLASKIVGVSAEAILETLISYPNSKAPPHWRWAGATANKHPVLFHSRLRSAPRLVIEALAQRFIDARVDARNRDQPRPRQPFSLPPTYRIKRICPVEHCVHPCCNVLKPQNFERYGFLHDLPDLLVTPEMSHERDVADLIEEFVEIEDPKLPDLLARYGSVFSEEQIRQAFAHVTRS